MPVTWSSMLMFVILAGLVVFFLWSVCVCIFLSVVYCICIKRRNRPGTLRRAPWSYMLGIGWLQVIIGWPLYQLCLQPESVSPSALDSQLIACQAIGAYLAWLSLPMWSAAFVAYVIVLRRRRRELEALDIDLAEPQIVLPFPQPDGGRRLGDARLFRDDGG